MNTKMLKRLVELSGHTDDCIDVDAFFASFGRDRSTLTDLRALEKMGFVSLLGLDADECSVEEIGVNKKAVDYFK